MIDASVSLSQPLRVTMRGGGGGAGRNMKPLHTTAPFSHAHTKDAMLGSSASPHSLDVERLQLRAVLTHGRDRGVRQLVAATACDEEGWWWWGEAQYEAAARHSPLIARTHERCNARVRSITPLT